MLVTRGMYELVDANDDQELAGVLAHELSHVVQRDHYEVIHKQEMQSYGKDLALSHVSVGGGTLQGQIVSTSQADVSLIATVEAGASLDLGPSRNGKRDVALVEEYGYQRVSLPAGGSVPPASEPRQASRPFGRASQVEIRPVEQRYVFVDGRRVGGPLD